MFPQRHDGCSGCEGGVGAQSDPRLADFEGPVLHAGVQRRPLRLFLFQCRLLRDDQNSESNVTLITNIKAPFFKSSNATSVFFFIFEFFDQYMLYENEIGLYHNTKGAAKGATFTSPIDPDYR